MERFAELVPWVESLAMPDGPLVAGARIRLTVKALGRHETADAVIVAAEPGRRLALEADVPQAKAHAAVAWDIAADGAGSRVTQRIAVEFRSIMARMAAKALLGDALSAETAEKGLAMLKRAVETDRTGGADDA